MCGICGTIGFGRNFVDAMNMSMKHRGPDSSGVWSDSDACLGHTRLAIIDLSDNGVQPMPNENKSIWVTFNGEIYNFKALKQELQGRGHIFRSQTDTEVIVHLYETYGEECLKYLRGMFAFAIWDTKNKKLFAARDRLGIKPLFYYVRGNIFIFASELKALLTTEFVERDIDITALAGFFSRGSVSAPLTMIKNVKQLLPGHYLTFEKGTLVIQRYWALNLPESTGAVKSHSDYSSEIAAILDEAVSLRMVSDVPLGVFLSGGVDSSIITGLMQRNSSRPIKTFSIIFEEKRYDERVFSGSIARRFGTDHTQILLTDSAILEEIPAIFDAMDQPSIDGFNTFVISKAVREKGIKVALSGLGGDELFAGYPLFKRLLKYARLINYAHGLPPSFRRKIFMTSQGFCKTRQSVKALLSLFGCNNLYDVYATERMVFSPWEVGKILSLDRNAAATTNIQRQHPVDIINTVSLLELTTYLRDTLLQDTDRMSMAHSLEVRVPFLDHILVEKILEIPGAAKISGAYPKQLLIDAVGNLLPQECYNRPKQGFVFPFEVWLKKGLHDYCAQKISYHNVKKISVLNPEITEHIWNDFHKGSKFYNYSSVIALLSFVNWYEHCCQR